MRKTVETHPELGHARLVMRADIMAIVCKYYRNNYRQDFNNWQTSFFVEGEKEPQLVAHAYARDTKKPGDLWYFKILLPEGAQTREQELLESKLPPKPELKKPSGFKLKLNLRVERLKSLQKKRVLNTALASRLGTCYKRGGATLALPIKETGHVRCNAWQRH